MAYQFQTYKGRKLLPGVSPEDAEVWNNSQAGLYTDRGQLGRQAQPPAGYEHRLNNIEAKRKYYEEEKGYEHGNVYISPKDEAQYRADELATAQEQLAEKQRVTAERLGEESSKFKTDLPSILERRGESARDESLMNLQKGSEAVKSNANARGLLFSGLHQGNQAQAKGFEGEALAKNLQNIREEGMNESNFRENLAQSGAQTSEAANLQLASYRQKASQSAYEQAMHKQQAQNAFYKSLFTAVGAVGGFVVGGPAGAAGGAALAGAASGAAFGE
jgi:hypothetical protein